MRMRVMAYLVGVLVFLVLGNLFLKSEKEKRWKQEENPAPNLTITSTAFRDGEAMDKRYTGRGEDLSPPLTFGEIDPEGESIAIIMDDLDHPIGLYNHWVVWNLPANIQSIPEGKPGGGLEGALKTGVQGRSEYGGKHYYRGPKPPFGSHRYIFRVYVLDQMLQLDENCGKKDLKKAMKGHILQYGTLTGVFGTETSKKK